MSLSAEHYLLFPGHEAEKIALLHSLVIFLLRDENIRRIDAFHLIPIETTRRHFFIYVDQGYVYCPGIDGFSVKIEPRAHEQPKTSCPFVREHEIQLIYHQLGEICSHRWPELSRLFFILADELTSETKCTFCSSRLRWATRVYESFSHMYPYTSIQCVLQFLKYPPTADSTQLMSVHLHALNCLFSQIRHFRQKVLDTVENILWDIHSIVSTAVEENDDIALERATQKFKHDMLTFLDTEARFVRTKQIDFKRWLLSLVFFIKIQEPPLCFQKKHERHVRIMKKTLLLLHLFFHHDRPLTLHDRFFTIDINGSCESITVDPMHLDTIHPFFRGDFLDKKIRESEDNRVPNKSFTAYT